MVMLHQPHRCSNSLWNSRGSVTAELAIAMPAVSLVIAITLGAFALQIERMKLVDVAATAARAIARGESEDTVIELVGQLTQSAQGNQLEFITLENLACVKLSKQIARPGLGAQMFELTESQCARKMVL
jgi:Flp pilus assembly protein TadG